MTVAIIQAGQAKEIAKTALAELPGVVGIGISKIGVDYAVKINLRAALLENAACPIRSPACP